MQVKTSRPLLFGSTRSQRNTFTSNDFIKWQLPYLSKTLVRSEFGIVNYKYIQRRSFSASRISWKDEEQGGSGIFSRITSRVKKIIGGEKETEKVVSEKKEEKPQIVQKELPKMAEETKKEDNTSTTSSGFGGLGKKILDTMGLDAAKLEKSVETGKFDMNDFKMYLLSMNKLGSAASAMKWIPGTKQFRDQLETMKDSIGGSNVIFENHVKLIDAMTEEGVPILVFYRIEDLKQGKELQQLHI